MSINNMSRSPHRVDCISCLIAPLSMGPLQTAALSSSKINPIELNLMLLAITGMNTFLPSILVISGFELVTLNNICWLGPYISASRMPILSDFDK